MSGVITNTLIDRAKKIPKTTPRKIEPKTKEKPDETKEEVKVKVQAELETVADVETDTQAKSKKPKKKKKKKPVIEKVEIESDEADIENDTDVRGPDQQSVEKPLLQQLPK